MTAVNEIDAPFTPSLMIWQLAMLIMTLMIVEVMENVTLRWLRIQNNDNHLSLNVKISSIQTVDFTEMG